ncbi:MAG: hypothetical protein K2Y05_02570 [Hyphomicrobiaceae bacterium]|nr:hypothetical protein [Hyphomicrobiaceae bacterium]
MRDQSLFPVVATTLTAFVFGAAAVLLPDMSHAADRSPPSRTPSAKTQPNKQAGSPYRDLTNRDFADVKPKFAPQSPTVPAKSTPARTVALDETDQFAALESVQFALSEVGDGASYVWHRHNGRLSGVVQPQSSFKTSTGEICRIVTVTLAAGVRSKSAEGVACRLPSGQWRLEG